MSMWKQLFSEAPPGAVEKLLSPKRKLFYAIFTFGPGTLLALFLSSIKRDMEREDDVRRLAHVAEEMQDEEAREQKDQLLLSMIQDMRDRLHALEREAQRAAAASAATPAAAGTVAVETQAPAATGDWDAQKAAFLRASARDTSGAAPKSGGGAAQSGISERIQQREREMIDADVRAFKAEKAAAEAHKAA